MTELKLTLSHRMNCLEGPSTFPELRSPAGNTPSQATLASLETALLGGETHYTVRPGIPELRRKIAEAIEAQGGPAPDAADPADNVVIMTAESEALFTILLGLELGPGTVLSDAPASCPHQAMLGLRALRLTTEISPEVSFVFRTFDMSEAAHSRLLTQAIEANLPDVLGMGTHWPPQLPVTDPQRTLIIGGLAGIKDLSLFQIGYLMGPQAMVARCRTWKQAFSICTAAPSQRAAVLCLSEEGP